MHSLHRLFAVRFRLQLVWNGGKPAALGVEKCGRGWQLGTGSRCVGLSTDDPPSIWVQPVHATPLAVLRSGQPLEYLGLTSLKVKPVPPTEPTLSERRSARACHNAALMCSASMLSQSTHAPSTAFRCSNRPERCPPGNRATVVTVAAHICRLPPVRETREDAKGSLVLSCLAFSIGGVSWISSPYVDSTSASRTDSGRLIKTTRSHLLLGHPTYSSSAYHLGPGLPNFLLARASLVALRFESNRAKDYQDPKEGKKRREQPKPRQQTRHDKENAMAINDGAAPPVVRQRPDSSPGNLGPCASVRKCPWQRAFQRRAS
ncbi:hypothetical protein B0J13DRAFT_636865 [Dactylonectria estremocensis]|uniref:Uncharacterized protein n=1 Tax=Dactylonectria estremocensis TaxID=1079267 RepID=A0A9P9J0V0_9HYPO|nr:hypothetical protein B0J13DRAFT_636865 [Dactylonectria estremocensis]